MRKDREKGLTINDNDNGDDNGDGAGAVERTFLLEKNAAKPESYFRSFILLLLQALFIGLSFSFSLGMTFLTVLIGHSKTPKNTARTSSALSANNELLTISPQSSNQTNLEVAPLALTSFESVSATAMSVYFGVGEEAGGKFTEIRTDDNEENKQKILQSMGNLFKGGFIVSIPLALLTAAPMIFLEPILESLGQEPETAAAAQDFTRILSIGIWPTFIRMCTEQYILGSGRSKIAMLIADTSLGIGTTVAGFLAFGPPRLGLSGIAGGFVLEALLTAVAFTLLSHFNKELSQIPYFTRWRGDGESFFESGMNILGQTAKLIKRGLPYVIENVFESPVSFAISVIGGLLGPNQLAALNFSQFMIFLTKIPQWSTGIAAFHKVSSTIKEDTKLAVRNAYMSIPVSIILVGAFAVPAIAYPDLVIDALSSSTDEDTRQLARPLIQYISLGTLIGAPNMVFIFVSKHVNDRIIPHVVTAISLWSGVVAGYYLSNNTNLGVSGLGIGYAASQLSCVVINGFRFFRNVSESKMKQRVVELNS